MPTDPVQAAGSHDFEDEAAEQAQSLQVAIHNKIRTLQATAIAKDDADLESLVHIVRANVIQTQIWLHEDIESVRRRLTDPGERLELLQDTSETFYKLNKIVVAFQEHSLKIREEREKSAKQKRNAQSRKSQASARKPR